MIHNDVKSNVNKLFQIYVTDKDEQNCIDELFILIYYHPKSFNITMSDEILNDFRSTLYPKIIKDIFLKYDEEKSSFFTFVCICLKNHARGFLRRLYLKNAIDESVFKELTNDESSKSSNEDNLVFQNNKLERSIDECNFNINYEEDDMKKMLSKWLLETDSLQAKKNYRKAIFVLSCKIAYILDENMISKIAKYIEIPENLFRYYISKVNLEYAISTNAKKIIEAKSQRDKYFIRKTTADTLLNGENLSESGKNILKCSKEYSIKKYKKACKKLKEEKQNISNRTIARITGISRSMIDRILVNIANILNYSPHIEK